MENLQAIAVIIGIVRGIVLAVQQLAPNVNVSSLIGFILSLVTGIILGLLHYFGLTVETGIVAALMATGVYQSLKKVGGQ